MWISQDFSDAMSLSGYPTELNNLYATGIHYKNLSSSAIGIEIIRNVVKKFSGPKYTYLYALPTDLRRRSLK